MADKALFDEDQWTHYSTVNKIVADVTLSALAAALEKRPDDEPIIWVHGYHLMLVPNLIRQAAKVDGLRCKIGYFMHIPFPPWDMIKIHPWKDFFLQGILGSDLIGFQCKDFALNFVDCCERGLATRVDRQLMVVEHGAGGRQVRVASLPVGVPFERFGALAESAAPVKLDIPTNAQVSLKCHHDNIITFVFRLCLEWILWTTQKVYCIESQPLRS